jgi:ubiquinone/menaquinone biosynthesis C-methylase UbiE
MNARRGLLWLLPVAAGVGFLIWRRQDRHLPCPASLSFLLENPFMNRVAGAERLLDRAGVAPGMRVLDAGCGPGRLTLPAARRVGPTGEVVAVDIQEAMLRRVQEKLDAQAVANVRLVSAGLGEGQLEPASFDRAFLVTVLGEIPDKAAALREIYGALKPGGLLSITEVLPDPDFQTPGAIRKLAGAAGFVEARIVGGFPAFTMNLVKPG